MSVLSSIWNSTIGKKAIMAITGLIIFGFVVGHMAGNLLVFAGQDAINAYAATLKATTPLLWGTRLVLLAAIPLHIVTAITLVRLNGAARPKKYASFSPLASTIMSRTMKYGGMLLMVFVVFHIAHYTLPWTFTDLKVLEDSAGRHDVYEMIRQGFSNPAFAIFYMLAMVALGLHLSHGVWSLMQTLGLNHPKYNDMRRTAAIAFGVILWLGFSAIPVAGMAGLLGEGEMSVASDEVEQASEQTALHQPAKGVTQ